MNRLLILISVLLIGYSSYSQTYRFTYKFTGVANSGPDFGSGMRVVLSYADGTTEQIYAINASHPNVQNLREDVVHDVLITSPVTEVAIVTFGYVTSMGGSSQTRRYNINTCVKPSDTQTSDIGTTVNFNLTQFPLENFMSLNTTAGNEFPECESKTLTAYSNTCTENMEYSVHYSTSISGPETELIPFGGHGTQFTLNGSDFSGVAPNTNIYVFLRYLENNTSNTNTSDAIIFKYEPCSPGLDGPIVDLQPDCSNSINTSDNNNGSFTVTFDRELDDTKSEKMNLQVFRQVGANFDGYASKTLEKSDFSGRSYTWTPRNLPGGTYKIFWQTKSNNQPFDNINTVPDAFGESAPFTLTTPPALSVSGNPTPVQCAGGDDGSITATPSGGTPPYQYSIDNGASWQNNTLFAGLSTGDYTILIQDNRGCQVNSASIDVDERFVSIPNVINLPLTSNPTLIDGDNGRIAISVSGGSGSYTSYVWTKDGNPFTPPAGSTNTNIIDLFEGVYTVVVTDSNGCSSLVETFTLIDPNPLEIQITMNPSSLDCSYDRGVLTATAAEGFLNPGGDYTYRWDDGTQGNTLADAQIGQTYTVTVSDQGGNSDDQSFQVLGPDPIITTIDQNPVTCKGGDDGSISLTIAGGTPIDIVTNPEQYNVTWTKIGDTGFTASGIAITGLQAGFYEYLITDQNNCTLDNFGTPIQVTEPPTGIEVFEVIDQHLDNIIFGGQAGVIQVEVINNNGAFTIQWFKDGNPFTPPSGSTPTRLIDLPVGTYSLIVNDTNCNTTLLQPIEITEPELLEILTTDKQDISCNGANDGSITVQVTGGIQPYTYLWERQGDPDFIRPDDPMADELQPGEYTVTITDDSGSTAIATSNLVTITQPELLEIVSINTSTVTCPQGNDGAIDIQVMGGTPPYTYSWSNGQNTQNIQDLQVGDYTISVRDDNNCITQAIIPVINRANQINIQQEIINNVSAYQGSDGSIQLTIEGGQQPYTFNWIRLSDNSVVGNTNTISNLIADTYQVTITDVNNCSLQNSYEITQPDIVEATITPLVCNGDCTASIQVEVNRGNGNFSFLWDNGQTSDTITNLCAGQYTVTIQGFGDKTLVRTYQIIDPEPVLVNLGDERFICLGQTTTLASTITYPNATYSWTADNGFTSNQQQVIVEQSGTYTLTVTDTNGCIGRDTVVVNEVQADVKAEFLSASQVFTNEKFVVIDVSNPQPDNIQWNIPEQAQIISQNQELIEIAFDTPGEYPLEMIATFGTCTDSYIQNILVLESEGLEQNPEKPNENQQLENIKDFTIFPNPSDGNFEVKVDLKETNPISITIFSLANNTIIDQQKQQGNDSYLIPFSLQTASGVYAIVLETPYGKKIRKMIIR